MSALKTGIHAISPIDKGNVLSERVFFITEKKCCETVKQTGRKFAQITRFARTTDSRFFTPILIKKLYRDEKFLPEHSINSSAHSPNEFALNWQSQKLVNFAF
jgi:hypothetical protein